MNINGPSAPTRIVLKIVTLLCFIICLPVLAQAQWANSGSNITTSNHVGIGIGIANPSAQLDVNGNLNLGSTGQSIQWNQFAYGSYLDVDNSQHALTIRRASDYGLMFRVSESTSYFQYGNVGVGTTNPDTKLHLRVASGTSVNTTFDLAKFYLGQAGAYPNNAINLPFQIYDEGNGVDRGTIATITAGQSGSGANVTQADVSGYGYLAFSTAANGALTSAERLRINSSGNVGIGTTSPGQKLQIGDNTASSLGVRIAPVGVNWDLLTDAGGNLNIANGNGNYLTFIKATSTSSFAGNVGIGTATPDSGYKLHVEGDVKVTGNIAAKYQDVAEWVPSSQRLSAGTVVVLDTSKSNHVLASSSSYDTKVAGVISAQPGISLGTSGEDKVLVATTGRVKAKVDASTVPIHVGDLLVTSDNEGMAMKSEPIVIGGRKMHSPGTIVGKALEPLEKGTGEILVLLSLQ